MSTVGPNEMGLNSESAARSAVAGRDSWVWWGGAVSDRDRSQTMLRAVELYYLDGMTQAAIADRLGCTRWTVGRLLRDALDAGLVKIEINHPLARRRDLEVELRRAFNLAVVQVVPTQATSVATLTALARLGADFLTDMRPRPSTVALGWGRTTAAMVRGVPDRWATGVTVVQAAGVPASLDDSITGASLTMLAKRGRGTARTFNAPCIAASDAEARKYHSDPQVSAVLDAAARADVILYSPGGLGQDTFISALDRAGAEDSETAAARLRDAGAVANILNRFIDATGRAVDPRLDARAIAILLDDLRKIRTKVVVGFGPEKTEAMAAAATAELADAMLTDADTAEQMLDAA